MKKTLLTYLFVLSSIIGFTQIGSFTVHNIATTATNPYVIDSGNLNSDAFPDIVVGTFSGNTVEIYINNGDGTFATPIIKSLTQVNGIHIADLDGVNGKDILASSYNGNKLVWYANNGNGTFANEEIISSSVETPGSIVTGDIDGDSTLDIALAVYGFEVNTDRVIWFANDGLPWTEQDIIPATAGLGPGDLDIVDIDGDTDLDIVVANTDAGTVELYYNNYNPLTDNNPVSFTESAGGDLSSGNTYLFDVSFADVNDDTFLDVLKVDLYGPEIAYYQNDGSGNFSEVIINNSHPYPSQAKCVDFNNDTYNDVVAADGLNQNDDMFWFESDNLGVLGTETRITDNNVHNQIYGMTINDFDNDGNLDLATIGYQDRTLKWVENKLDLLSIGDNSINKIIMFPNPTKNQLNFKGLSENIDVSVYDIVGKNVLNKNLDVNESLNVSKLQSGIYILKFKDYNSTFKFIKE